MSNINSGQGAVRIHTNEQQKLTGRCSTNSYQLLPWTRHAQPSVAIHSHAHTQPSLATHTDETEYLLGITLGVRACWRAWGRGVEQEQRQSSSTKHSIKITLNIHTSSMFKFTVAVEVHIQTTVQYQFANSYKQMTIPVAVTSTK